MTQQPHNGNSKHIIITWEWICHGLGMNIQLLNRVSIISEIIIDMKLQWKTWEITLTYIVQQKKTRYA